LGGHAGLVATNSVSQNRNRSASLQWIVDTGGVITHAISKKPWSGEAVVNVSIVNWVKRPIGDVHPVLDGVAVGEISAALRPGESDVASAQRLPQNRQRAFQGPIPAGEGFVLAPAEAQSLLTRRDAAYSDVVFPYLIGEDIADDPKQSPSRWIINFGKRSLEEAACYSAALEIVRERVKPIRDVTIREPNHTYWWLFERPRPAMQAALSGLTRFIASLAQGKRIFFTWQKATTCPSNLTNVFAFGSDYAMGVLCSTIHHEWGRAQSSTLRLDFRYTPTSAFETFPWPVAVGDGRDEIALLTRRLIEMRSAICLEREIGLTRLYNEVDDGAYRPLYNLHRELDEAVAAAYGWPASAAHDPNESNRLLLELNRAIAAGEVEYRPFEGV
jgi:hypothetical protein